MNNNIIFIEGITATETPEHLKDFLIANISIGKKLIDFYEKNKNERGYLNGVIKKSKKGGLYVELNTWKPTQKTKQEDTSVSETNEIRPEDIPF